jgi:oxygen-dependent protoporphyrinogen oxidase
MGALTEKLSKLLEGAIYRSTPVQGLEKNGETWRILTPWSAYDADAVCLAVPSYAAARILKENYPELSGQLEQIRFEPVATLNYLFRREAVNHPLNGFGFVVPAAEKSCLIGCSFSHQKFEGRVAGDDRVLLRAFAGGAYGRALLDDTDEHVIETVLAEVKKILGITEEPLKIKLSRYPQGMPQYEVGHLKRTEEIFDSAKKEKGLFLTGLSYQGIGIPDCVKAARETAAEMEQFFLSRALSLESRV